MVGSAGPLHTEDQFGALLPQSTVIIDSIIESKMDLCKL